MPKLDEELRRELDALTERIARLEGSRAPRENTTTTTDDADGFWALGGLRSRLDQHPDTEGGAVMIVGSLTLPDGGPVAWQQGAGTSGMFETDWSEYAATLTSLAHPVRLELLRHIASGVHATAELAELAALGTTGQLHHHLRQLIAAGWVRQSGRGSYEVPAARVVPLLACLVGAQR
ncbi:MAG: ArsR family transcriptional regulator [Leifsonia xyli]|nr:MAG: ArsR family transcriptional regulator [Leifsonia xyli]